MARSTKRLSLQDILSRDDTNMPEHATITKITIPERTSSQRKSWTSIPRAKPPGSHSFNEIPMLRRTPWETQRKPRHSVQSRRSIAPNGLSTHIFHQLPTQVFNCILKHLMLEYVSDMVVDVAGILSELRACCLVSKMWLHPAREHLYYNIWLLRNEPSRRRKYALSRPKSRMELLQRTLREERQLAQLVRRISVTPSLQRELLSPKSFLSRSRHALDLMRELIDLCPLLEQVDGFLPDLTPQYSNYFQALLRRPYLRTLVWWTHPDSWFLVDLGRLGQYEDSWQHLHTLVLSQGNSTKSLSMTPGSILRLLRQTPNLKSLMLAGLSQEDVNDETLQMLPALSRLRLDDLAGVTDEGLVNFSESEEATSLRSLTLSGLQVKSLRTISVILDGCYNLERFRFVQMQTPEWSIDDSEAACYLESDSLQYLHWETLMPGDAAQDFAQAILQDAFPMLSVVKAPCDHEGHLQAVCRPIHEQPLTPDDARFLDRGKLHDSSYSIRLAQLRAQQRIREQRRMPSFNFIVKDEDEALQHTDVIGAFLGRLDSGIEYRLEPDIPGSAVALSHLSDFIDPHVQEQTNASMSSLDLSVARCPAYAYSLLF